MRFALATASLLVVLPAFAQDAAPADEQPTAPAEQPAAGESAEQPSADQSPEQTEAQRQAAQTAQQLEDLQSQVEALGQDAQSSDAQTAQQLADLQTQVDALAALPAEEAEARRERASTYVDATAQLAEVQDALTYGQADVTAALEDIQAQLDDLAQGDELGQTAEEVRWTRASVAALSLALEQIGQSELFVARQYLTIAAVQLARARRVALGG